MQTQDILQQAFTDITDVGSTLFQIFVIELFQRFRLAFDHRKGSGIRSGMLVFNQGNDFLLKLFIFQQHDMPLEDRFFLFTEGFSGFDFDRFQLHGSLFTTIKKTLNFLIDLVGSNLLPVDDNLIFFQQKRLAKSDTR